LQDIKKLYKDSPVEVATLIGALAMFGANARTVDEAQSGFTKADMSDPAFKYFSDKGMSLPNTSLKYETVTDEDAQTKKTISDYPQETQELYMTTHTEYLKEALQDIINNDEVYVKSYKDAKGDKVSQVYINEPEEGEYDSKELSKLDKKELAQVLHIAQTQATTKAKKEIFYDK